MCGRTCVWLVVAMAILAWPAAASADAVYTTYDNYLVGDYGNTGTSPGAGWANTPDGNTADPPYNGNYAYALGPISATWSWGQLAPGATYDVYASFTAGTNRPTNVAYSANGTALATVNQQNANIGAYYHLEMGQNAAFALLGTATVNGAGNLSVVASNTDSSKYLIADAGGDPSGPGADHRQLLRRLPCHECWHVLRTGILLYGT